MQDHMSVEITHEFSLNKAGELFLRFDSKTCGLKEKFNQNKQRIIMFASKEVFIELKTKIQIFLVFGLFESEPHMECGWQL